MAGDGGELSRWLGAVLGFGTALAMLIVAVGVALDLIDAGSGSASNGRPLLEVLAEGGAVSIIAGGLVTLAFVPLAQMAVGAAAFARRGENRYVIAAVLVTILLLVSLATALLTASVGSA